MNTVHNKNHGTAPLGAVYIGRGSPYGNPFVIDKDGTRDEVCDKYVVHLLNHPELVKHIKDHLSGRDLVCFCKPRRCHGDLLLVIANS